MLERSIVPFQLEHSLLEHLLGLAGQPLSGSFQVHGERVGGNLLENAQRGDRTLKIADQHLRELDPHLERAGGVIPAAAIPGLRFSLRATASLFPVFSGVFYKFYVQGSTIRIGYNTYSVSSRLIGEKVDVHIKVECLEVWHGAVLVERLPRRRGRNQHAINYRHVIDWLVRKPGAFAGYRYQDAMFPTSRFRRAYDALLERSPGRAAKDYLRILELAAKQSETGVDAVLDRLLEWNVPITPTVVADHLAHDLGLPRAMEVTITTVDLSLYDGLLETREDMPLTDQPTCTSP